MLPKIKLPYYEIKLPDNNDIIHIKPYTIEVEKFLITLDKKNITLSEQLKVCKEILKYCVVEEYDFDKLAIGTIQWLFLKCYEISVKDNIEFVNIHKCNDKEEHKTNITIYIKDIVYEYNDKKVRIPIETEEGKYYLEYGCLKFNCINYIDNESDSLKLMASCLERMYDEKGNNELDLTFEDKIEATKSLSLSDIAKVGEVIQQTNKPYFNLEYDCPNCGKHIKEKLEDFFI